MTSMGASISGNVAPPALPALAVCVSAGVPAVLWGEPGTGKTSTIRALASELALPCETVIASIREPTDFSGLPIVSGNGVEFAPPKWARRLAEAESGILFLDEISTSPPAVQSALLRVVLERVVGDLALPADIRIVAAGNPAGSSGDNWYLTPALANRFCHLDWRMPVAVFAAGFRDGWPKPQAPRLPDNWEVGIQRHRASIATFSQLRPSLLLARPNDPSRAGRGWPSPRSWDILARLLAAADSIGASAELGLTLARGAVGDGAGVEYMVWQERPDLPDPESLLSAPETATTIDRLDLLHVLLEAVVAAVADHPTAERWLAGWAVLGAAAGHAPDVAAVAARTLAQCRPPGVEIPSTADVFQPILEAAGMFR